MTRYTRISRESFDGADLATAPAQRVRFERCSFRGTDLRHATLDRSNFKLCDLRYADLRGASLRGVSFAGCDLRDTDLRDSDLTAADFGRVLTGTPPHGLTDVTGARFAGAVLREVQAEHVIGWSDAGRSRGSAR